MGSGPAMTPDDIRAQANQEIVVRSAFQLLAFRLRQFGLLKQSEAMDVLAENPDLREDIADAIIQRTESINS